MITVWTREYEYSAAHQIEGHPKCGRMHGHDFRIQLRVTGTESALDSMGFVVDYYELDQLMEQFVAPKMDHRLLNETFPGHPPSVEWLAVGIYDLLAEKVERLAGGRGFLAGVRVYEGNHGQVEYAR